MKTVKIEISGSVSMDVKHTIAEALEEWLSEYIEAKADVGLRDVDTLYARMEAMRGKVEGRIKVKG